MTTAQDKQSRAEFDIWWEEHGLGSYDSQLEAWQAARALPAGDDALLPIAAKSHGAWDGLEELLAVPDGTEVYTAAQVQAMGRVPPCPYHCGWEGLHKIAVADGAYLARTEWPEDEEGVSVKRATVMRNIGYLIDVCRAMLAAAPRPPAAQERAA